MDAQYCLMVVMLITLQHELRPYKVHISYTNIPSRKRHGIKPHHYWYLYKAQPFYINAKGKYFGPLSQYFPPPISSFLPCFSVLNNRKALILPCSLRGRSWPRYLHFISALLLISYPIQELGKYIWATKC